MTIWVALYGAPLWVSTATVAYRHVKMERVQRQTGLKCISQYRPILAFAVNILTGIPPPPTDATIAEIMESYMAIQAMSTLQEWKQMENLVRQNHDPDAWINRRHTQLPFHLKQLLHDHRAFLDYFTSYGPKTGSDVYSLL